MTRQEFYSSFGMVDEHNLLYSIPSTATVSPSAETGPAPEISLPGSNSWGSPVASAQAEVCNPTPTTSDTKRATSTERGKAASAGKTAAKKKRKCGRPLTGYNIFFKEQRDNVAALRRSMTSKSGCPSIAKLISIKWKELSAGERAQFDTLAAQEKLRQYNEMQGWVNYEDSDEDQNESAGEPEVVYKQQGNPFFIQNQPGEDFAPWPIESIHAIAKELDDECIDILIRALL